jgi:hypothetical protein
MLHCFCPEETSLLDDLLAASASLYHRNVATVQRVFADQYVQTVRDRQAQDLLFREEELLSYWHALKAKQDEMILEQSNLRRERDANIRAYVASQSGAQEAAA